MKEIKHPIIYISDSFAFYPAQVKTLDLSETLMESYYARRYK